MTAKQEAAPVANRHRGEIAITLGGRDFVLRPDFEATAAIDEQLGGIIALVRRAIESKGADLTMREIAVVVCEGIKATGRKTKTVDQHSGLETVSRMIFEAGIPTAIPAVLAFLGAAVTGGADQEQRPGKE